MYFKKEEILTKRSRQVVSDWKLIMHQVGQVPPLSTLACLFHSFLLCFTLRDYSDDKACFYQGMHGGSGISGKCKTLPVRKSRDKGL